jgi:two-component sensor histidine kinase
MAIISIRWAPDLKLMPRRIDSHFPAAGPERAEDLLRRVTVLESELGQRDQETQRRFRNMLAMVRAIIRQTGDDVDTLDDYRALIEGRIASFTRVQSLLLSDHEAGIDLFTMVADEVLLAGLDARTVECRGESVQLSAAAAGLFALLTHELVQGTASSSMTANQYPVAWIDREISDREQGRFLCIHWHERFHRSSTGQERAAGDWIEDALTYELGAHIEHGEDEGGAVYSYVIPLETALARER